MRPGRVLLLCIVALAMLAVAIYWPRTPSDEDAPPTAIYGPRDARASNSAQAANDLVDGTLYPLRAVARVEPGTRVGNDAPEGWTHLIYKTHTRLASGDIDALPDFARSLAEFLFTIMVVRVEQSEGGPWRIEQVAVGLGTQIGDDDVILSSDTHKQLGADLGLWKLTVLTRAEERLGLLRVAAGTESMVVLDAPTLIRLGDKNCETVLRYLFLIDARTGGLATVIWRLDTDAGGRYLGLGSAPILAAPAYVSTAELHVDGSKIIAGIPTSQAFAPTQMPPGVTLEMPTALQSIAARKQLTHAMAAEMERQFRAVLEAMRPR